MAIIPAPPTSHLFDRARSAHPWLAALDALQGSTVPGHAALAQNWRMDGRVDSARENELVSADCFPSGKHKKGFHSAAREYFAQYQCRPATKHPRAAYADASNNSNLIPRSERPLRSQRLLHLASVQGLLRDALNPAVDGMDDFQTVITDLTGIDFDLLQKPKIATMDMAAKIDAMVQALQAKGIDATKKFVQALSHALGDTEPNWWAAFSHEIGDLSATSDWTDAVQMTGQGHIKRGEWLLAWCYSPDIAGKLYRPTVAEAADCAFHFPAHEAEPYGITMPLASGLRPVRELIHAPLKDDAVALACIGFGRVLGDPAAIHGEHEAASWFQTRRREHAEALINPKSSHDPVHQWLQRHAILS